MPGKSNSIQRKENSQMSRYVRTYNGYCGDIIDLDRTVYGRRASHYNEGEIDTNSPAGYYWPESEEYGIELECRDKDIIAQADTIEELCDEFVYARTLSDGRRIIRNFKHISGTRCKKDEFCILFTTDESQDIHIAQSIAEQQVKNGVYGAIWDCRGLIYVAKMNVKGEFVLL